VPASPQKQKKILIGELQLVSLLPFLSTCLTKSHRGNKGPQLFEPELNDFVCVFVFVFLSMGDNGDDHRVKYSGGHPHLFFFVFSCMDDPCVRMMKGNDVR
jgi:hypothetical protein